MVIANPKSQVHQGIDEARKELALNNSATSKVSDNLLSILDAGDGSMYLRDQIDHILHQIAQGGVAAGYQWTELRKMLGIKEKIAYLVGHTYAHAAEMGMVPGVANAAAVTPLNQNQLRAKLDQVIRVLETELLNNQDFTESFIIRHAAFNRFEAKLDQKAKVELTSLSGAIQKMAKDNGFDTIEATMHFQHESDAQKIIKISEAVSMMTQAGVAMDAKLMDRFEKMAEKIKPLKELDKHYKHLMNMLNLVHRTARKGYPAMITSSQQKKLFAVLKEMDVADPTVFIMDASKVDANGDPAYLDKELLTLKRKDPIRLKGVLDKYVMTEDELENWFNSYFSYSSVERAKTDLDKQKQVTFGHRLKDYEHDVNAWRGIARERVLAIHTTPANPNAVPPTLAMPRMMGDPLDFANDDDFNFANSYFDKFPDLFYANEEDADRATGGHYQQMRDIVSALVRRRVPALAIGNRRRFGSALRRAITSISNPQIKAMITRSYHRATDDQLIAMIIMSQNEAKHSMFYADKNPFEKKKGFMQRFSKLISRSEHGRAAVRDAVAPSANKLLRLGEGALRLGAKATNKVISNTGRLATWASSGALGKINRLIEGKKARETNGKDWDFKWYKTPLYAVWLATRTAEEGLKAANKGFNYTNANGNNIMHNMREKVVSMLQEGFNDKGITNVYQGFTHALEDVSSFVGKGVSWVGNAEHERRDVNQKRNVLSAFYEAAAKEEDLEELMASSDLAQMLNLKERGPYLFDEDGRVAGADKAEVKQDTGLEATTKSLSSALKTQLDEMIQQADEQYNKKNDAVVTAQEGTDEKKKMLADIDFTHANDVRADARTIKGSMIKLSPLLKAPLTTAVPPVWKKAEFDGVLDELDGKFNNAIAPLGIINKLEAEIGDAAAGLTHEVNTAFTNLNNANSAITTQERIMRNAQASITSLQGNLRSAKNSADRQDIQDRIDTAQALIDGAEAPLQIAQNDKAVAEQEYMQKNRALSQKKQHLKYLQSLDQWVKDMRQVSDDMDAAINAANAAGTSVADATQSLVERMTDMTKNLNLLISPKKASNTVDLASKIADLQKQLADALKAANPAAAA